MFADILTGILKIGQVRSKGIISNRKFRIRFSGKSGSSQQELLRVQWSFDLVGYSECPPRYGKPGSRNVLGRISRNL